MFLTLIKDTSSDVRLPLLRNLEALNNVIGIESIADNLTSAIKQLAGDKKWRVRLTIIDYSTIMAKIMSEKLFQEQFGSLCLSWLDDNVFAIREAGIKNLKELTAVLGSSWAEKYVLPKLLGYQSHSNYLLRMTPLFALPLLAPQLSQSALEKTVVPFILNQVADKVANIRFNVARSLKAIAPLIKNSSLQAAVNKTLTQLSFDPDPEVKYFSKQGK